MNGHMMRVELNIVIKGLMMDIQPYRKNGERTTENKMEKCMIEKFRIESGCGYEHRDLEKEDNQSEQKTKRHRHRRAHTHTSLSVCLIEWH